MFGLTNMTVWEKKRSWISILMFVIGATSSVDYSLVGRVTVAETIAFAFVPYFWLSRHRSYVNESFKKSIALLLLMFFGTILGDLINQTPFLFSARAFAKPVFMLAFLLFFVPVLTRDPLSIIYLVYGRVLTGVLNFFRPSQFETEGAADAGSYAGVVFRLEPLIAAVAIALAVFIYPRSRMLAALAFLSGGAAVVVAGGSRSGILMWVAAAAMLIVIRVFKSKTSRRIQLSPVRLIVINAILILSLTLVYYFYIWAAPQGYLGETQQIKLQEQQKTVFGASPLGFIIAGRPQVYGAILGIIERPLFGFGSWRHDITSYFVIEAILSVGTDPTTLEAINRGAEAGGAGHSVLFQAWVENGLLPAIAYVLIYIIIIRVFLFNIKCENRLTPYFILVFISFSWGFFFSPPGLGLRFLIGLFLAFYVVFMDRKKPLARILVMS